MIADDLVPLLTQGLRETAYMVAVAALLSALGGLLVGVLLVLTGRDGLLPARPVNALLGLVVNVGRSLPFIILLVAIIPVTRAVVGTTIGTTAAIVPLTVSAIPFYARIVETALREVDRDVIAAARAMGANRRQIVGKVLLREARPGLVAGFTLTVVALIGYSAMAGVIGGGGLGDLALRYGYQRFENDVMIATVVLLVAFVQLVQVVGDVITRRLSHR
ncbi:methionine ABC transporter permease [Micromonospora sp. C28SCA-DRY-2]|uniref:D-methionine transport system permease protein n=2 Tax=Micromonosporaceae TaxID=28056 RepID=A0A1C5K429_9ACTN|nr:MULTISPECIES: methionine ABC transporter permease [Micromonospora]MDO3703797.1 methionine ABC transporter permease [Micromonospora sp. C28SCA-DRY-2]PWU46865.1 ABC transporter permease [Micromonospora sp. S4605]SCG77351.1 D-methionine transport system permease protein [Micromonospora echinaurantiaca]